MSIAIQEAIRQLNECKVNKTSRSLREGVKALKTRKQLSESRVIARKKNQLNEGAIKDFGNKVANKFGKGKKYWVVVETGENQKVAYDASTEKEVNQLKRCAEEQGYKVLKVKTNTYSEWKQHNEDSRRKDRDPEVAPVYSQFEESIKEGYAKP